MTEPRSTLGQFAPLSREADPMHARIAARQAWQNINPEWLGWADRKQAELLAEKLFGKQRVGK